MTDTRQQQDTLEQEQWAEWHASREAPAAAIGIADGHKCSAEVDQIFAALSQLQGDISNPAKNKSNPYFKSNYADLAACWGVLRDHLTQHGLCVTQWPMAGKDGVINIVTIIGHKSGQWMRGVLPMRPVKDDPQGVGSAITYGRRYALAAAIGFAQEDDDGNAATSKAPSGLHERQVNSITTTLEAYGMDAAPILTHYQVSKLADLPPAKYATVMKQIHAKGKVKVAKESQESKQPDDGGQG